ncbi:MAG: prepilin peptidase [Planctomycetes bacterium]|nr:prepilin peptidase [Planctomycetota bacterium]
MLLVTLWWLTFWTAIGLCLGSFLNVVIYRLPRDFSLRSPLWSACPHCQARIRWHDNLPILSFLRLRGRCRDCGGSIATRYLVVEASMALLVLVLLDGFFIAGARQGLCRSPFGLTEQMSLDWPILAAHVILFACLLSMSAIDLEHYWVDVRFTNFATLSGFVLHALWTPRHSMAWARPSDTMAVVSLAAVAGLGIVWAINRRNRTEPPDAKTAPMTADPGVAPAAFAEATPSASEGATTQDSARPRPEDEFPLTGPFDETPERGRGPGFPYDEAQPASLDASTSSGSLPDEADRVPAPDEPTDIAARPVGITRDSSAWTRLPGVIGALLVVGLFTALTLAAGGGDVPRYEVRSLVPIALFFLLVVREGAVVRESDQRIVDAIHSERHGARRMVLGECALLLPAVVLGMAGFWLMQRGGAPADRIAGVLHYRLHADALALWRTWAPVEGLATAAAGYVIGGAIGWTVRIFFTLAFGKEAFGTGDIHLMAAAGCVAGWPVVALGFFLTCLLAIVGWVLNLPFKRSRALPLGPWLSLSFLIVVLFYDALLRLPLVDRTVDLARLLISRSAPIFPAGGP